MKNIIFALLILLLISVTGIQLYAAGEPNSLPDHCSPNAPAYLRDPIGCPCTTNWAEASAALPGLAPRDSDMIEPGDLYCYIPAGSYSARGTMRRCTVDQQAGKTGYDNPPCECRENRFDGSKRVFCRKNYCDSCQRSSDCPQGIPDSKDKSSCLMGKYFEKSKRCHTCKHIMGDGPIKVTLYFINLPPGVYDQIEAARGLVAGLLSIEPFGYLHNIKHKFTFQLVLPGGAPNEFIPEDFKTYLSQLGNSDRPGDPTIRNLPFLKYFQGYADRVCPGSDYHIFIDGINLPFGGSAGFVHNIKPSLSSKSAFVMYSSIITAHELGHSMGQLEEEYPLSRSRYTAININFAPLSLLDTRCVSFDNKGVPLPNCYALCKYNDDGKLEYDWDAEKSTPYSLMANNASEFNIISCAGLLNKIEGIGEREAVRYCTDTPTPEGYRIFDGVLDQPAP